MADPAEVFTAMAERLAKIDASEFAGAAVIVAKDGMPIEFLLVDPTPSAPQFWSGVQTRVEIGAAKARDAEVDAASSPFGRAMR